jgi:hypothetical protein
MRDYSNMMYHGLLDWRLALDMARVAAGQNIIDLNSDWMSFPNPWQGPLTTSVPMTMAKLHYNSPEAFGRLRGYVNSDLKRIWIEVHPLWQDEHPEYQEALHDAQARYPRYEAGRLNPFRALRRPSDYV